MSDHYVTKCRIHGTVYGQCRCPSPSKTVSLVDCDPRLCPTTPTVSTTQPPLTGQSTDVPAYLRVKYATHGLDSSAYTYEEWCAIYPLTKEGNR